MIGRPGASLQVAGVDVKARNTTTVAAIRIKSPSIKRARRRGRRQLNSLARGKSGQLVKTALEKERRRQGDRDEGWDPCSTSTAVQEHFNISVPKGGPYPSPGTGTGYRSVPVPRGERGRRKTIRNAVRRRSGSRGSHHGSCPSLGNPHR